MDPIVDYRWLRGLKKHSDPRVRHAWLEMTYQEAVHLKVSVAVSARLTRPRRFAAVAFPRAGCRLRGSITGWRSEVRCPLSAGIQVDARVRAQAVRCLAGVFRPEAHRDLFIFRDSDLTHVVASLFITYDGGPVYVQQQVLKSLCKQPSFGDY